MKKTISLISVFFVLFTIYGTWQLSRISLGFAIIYACVCFVILTWILGLGSNKKEPVNWTAEEIIDQINNK
jgi:hypothetical protein